MQLFVKIQNSPICLRKHCGSVISYYIISFAVSSKPHLCTSVLELGHEQWPCFSKVLFLFKKLLNTSEGPETLQVTHSNYFPIL